MVDDSDGEVEEIDVSESLRFMLDWENHEIGWVCYEGKDSDFRFEHHSLGLMDRPGGDYKESLRLRMRVCPEAGGDICRLTATSSILRKALSELGSEIESSPDYEAGRLPEIEFISSTHDARYPEYFAPVFEIIGWRNRSAFETGLWEV